MDKLNWLMILLIFVIVFRLLFLVLILQWNYLLIIPKSLSLTILFSYEFIRVVGPSAYNTSSVYEYIAIASEIKSGDHCQADNLPLSNKRVFNWLDGTFNRTG